MAFSWVYGACFCLVHVGWCWCFGVGCGIVGGFVVRMLEDGLRVVAAMVWLNVYDGCDVGGF
jgi:hypothetical protein